MSQLQELINTDPNVLVDFCATWSEPCKKMEETLVQLKSLMGNKLTILKVDVDKNPTATNHHNINAVPTLMLFNKGQLKWQGAGQLPATALKFIVDYNAEPIK